MKYLFLSLLALAVFGASADACPIVGASVVGYTDPTVGIQCVAPAVTYSAPTCAVASAVPAFGYSTASFAAGGGGYGFNAFGHGFTRFRAAGHFGFGAGGLVAPFVNIGIGGRGVVRGRFRFVR